MNIDLELYRRQIRVSLQPRIQLSVIDIMPEYPRQTMVFIHGFGGAAVQWRYQLNQFSLFNRVIAVDLRGHGQSDRPDSQYSMPELQDDIHTLLLSLGINQPVTLVGHSFGGAVAATYAAANPWRVKNLVLVASAVRFKLQTLYRVGMRLPNRIARLVDPMLRGRVFAPAHVLKAEYWNNLATWDGEQVYQSLKMPVLVVRGYRDNVFEKPAFDQVSRLIPQAEEVDVGASGHMVMLERAEAVNRAMGRFIEAVDPAWTTPELGQEDQERVAMLKSRPWLARYDQAIPHTIAVPQIGLPDLLQSASRRFPNRSALVYEGRAINYKSLQQDVNRFAHALLALGVKRGERVVLMLPNLPQWVVAFYGILQMGAVAVLLSPDADPVQAAASVQSCEARVFVAWNKQAALIEHLTSQTNPRGKPVLDHLIVVDDRDSMSLRKRMKFPGKQVQVGQSHQGTPNCWLHDYFALLGEQPDEAPLINIGGAELAVIHYTSGSTQQLKGVMLSHRNLIANTLQTRHWMPDAQEGVERFLCVVPLAHSYGLTAGLNIPISIGATIILEASYDAGRLLADIQRYRPTVFPAVPKIFTSIMNYPDVRRYGMDTIKYCISGSEPMPIEVLETFEKITRTSLIEGYGLTEASPITHINPFSGLRKLGMIGIPISSTEARLVNLRSGKRSVPSGQIGELAVRGPQVMMGYWKDQAATSRVLSQDGWLLTGDVAQMDSEGYFRIIARKDEMWFAGRADQPVSPRAIEEVLHEVPQVKEAVAVAIAGQPVAFVIPQRDKPTAEALIAYCKRRLPPDLVPRMVIFVDEFPRSFIGKVLRQELAKRLHEKNVSLSGTAPDQALTQEVGDALDA